MFLAVAFRSIKTMMHKRPLPFCRLPSFLFNEGFKALEISDRELARLSSNDFEDLVEASHKSGFELIVDINADLTLRNPTARREEISHALALLKLARVMDVNLCRISLGGQAVSLQKLLKTKLRTSAPTQGNSDSKANNTLPSPTSFQTMTNFAHFLRKQIPAISWNTAVKIDLAIASLQIITHTAEQLGITIGIENHWGISSRPEWILRVIQGVASPAIGSCPDFDNWPLGVSPDKGVAQLAPHAVIAHVKSLDPRKDTDKQRSSIVRKINILQHHHFSGPLTIEHEAAGDAWQQIRMTRGLICEHLTRR